jgi:beta-phosphoglucomutase-like phosphatase (HAD superfamily)
MKPFSSIWEGVVTDTVSIHATCWKTMFDEVLQKWAMRNAQRFHSFDLVTDYKLLRNLFADDPKGGERMTAEGAGFYLDCSKNRITAETLKLLLQLADESGLRQRIDSMFRGEKIKRTENRAVLHVALGPARQTL